MKYSTGISWVAAWFAIAQATNVNGDPTDLRNYPSCAQTCIPPAFGPPANCGSLSNRTCICQNPLYADAITACQLTTCSRQELADINQLGASLCASVGGIDAILTEADELLATASLEISTTLTYPPDVTGIDQASAVLASATPAPDLGNPAGGADSGVFPPCALLCANLTAGLITDPNSLAQVCAVVFRRQNAICTSAVCTNIDRQTSQLLAQQLCGPYYNNNASLGSSVSAAIASATPIAQAAVVGKNASNPANYPECARNCILSTNNGGCGDFPNANCLCNNITANRALGECQLNACEGDDITRTAAFAYQVCAPNGGGVFPANNGSAVAPNQTATLVMVPSATAVEPFMGAGCIGRVGSWVLAVAPLVAITGMLL